MVFLLCSFILFLHMNTTADRNLGQAHNIIEIGSPHSSPFSFSLCHQQRNWGRRWGDLVLIRTK